MKGPKASLHKSKGPHHDRLGKMAKNDRAQPQQAKKQQQRSMMDCYYDLASDNASQRLKGAASLLEQLVEKDSSEDWDYALNRLVKGLSSSHGSARLGFSVALSELLSARQNHIDVTQYLDLADKHFEGQGKLTGQEQRGLQFGRLFALRVLVQSPLLLREGTTFEQYSRFLDMSLALAVAKPWLRESVFLALCDVINKLVGPTATKPSLSFDVAKAVNYCLQKVEDSGLTKTSEGVALYLSAISSGSSTDIVSFKSSWKNNDPLSKGNLSDLAKALKEVPIENEQKQQQKGVWKPTLNFVWPFLLRELTSTNTPESESEGGSRKKRKKDNTSEKRKSSSDSSTQRILLPEFWTAVVDEGMFSATSSAEKKFWGFEVFNLFVSHVADPSILFGKNFLRTLVNHFSQSDRNLNKEAKKVMSCIQDAVRNKPCASDIVRIFIQQGEPKMKKAIEQILTAVSADQLYSIVSLLTSPSDKTSIKPNWTSDLLVSLVKSRRSEEGSARWLEKIVEYFVQHAFFKNSTSDDTKSTTEMFQSKLNSVLSQVIGVVRDDNSTWAYYALSRIVATEEKGETLCVGFDDETLVTARNKSLKTLNKIRRKRVSSSHTDSSQLEAFELLFSLVLLQVYCGDPESGMVLDELHTCYNVILAKANKEEGGDDGESTEVDASQVLTEIVISFASRQSALLRRVSETVFGVFASEMTQESMYLLYDVLYAKENLEGQQQVFEGEDEMVEEGSSPSDSDHDHDHDHDMDVDADESDGDNDDDDSSSSSDASSDSETDDVDENEDAERQANQALAKVLGVQSSLGDRGEGDDKQDQDEEDNESESDSDESMDDEQMMALDHQLATIFRERQNAVSKSKSLKIEAASAKQNMVQLKSKIIDLLDVYVRAQPSSSLVLGCILPLLSVIGSTKDVALGNKAHQLLKNRVCRGKETPRLSFEPNSLDDDKPGLDGEDAIDILGRIQAAAFKSKNKSYAQACNQTSTLITKILLTADRKKYADQIANLFYQSLSKWMEEKSAKVSPALFHDIINYVASTK